MAELRIFFTDGRCHLHHQHDSHLWHPPFFRSLSPHSGGISLEPGDIAMMMSLNILIYGFLAPVAGGG
jgi:hypothetical protein